jgi:aldehyde:ferredoxin oxidoreductase
MRICRQHSRLTCLFAREVYKDKLLADCLISLGYSNLAGNMGEVSQHIQKLRWKTRLATGFDPVAVKIPRRFSEVTNWKGAIDEVFMTALKNEYGKRIIELSGT